MNRILVGFILTTAILVIGLQAQAGPAPIGTVSVSKNQWSCPTTPPDDYPAGMTCQHAIVYCPNGPNGIAVQPLGVTFGYMTPPSPLGTIVFLSGEGGTTPNGGTPPFPAGTYSFTQYAEDYYNDGYQVILTAWDSAWEDVTNGGSGKKSVGYAACRPATFLNWVYGYFYVPIQSAYQPAGMCAQTASAGAGAGAFDLAWYGGTAYMDKFSMISGPPLSDIDQGCMVPNSNPNVEVCPPVIPPQVNFCNQDSVMKSWTEAIKYTDALNGVEAWADETNPPPQYVCQNSSGTAGAADAAWKQMSIVDGTVGTFNYASTNITAWLCSSVSSSCTSDCAMNNSSPEAQLFFQNFTATTQIPQGLTINGVGSCNNAEEVGPGVPPSNYLGKIYNPNNPMDVVTNGWQAVEYDMVLDPLNSCVSHHVE